MNLKVGQHVGVLRQGSTLDYSGLVTEVISPTKARIKFSDGRVEVCSTHPDFVVSMEPAYAVVGEFLRQHDSEQVREEELEAFVAGRLDFFEAQRAKWLLRRLAEVVA